MIDNKVEGRSLRIVKVSDTELFFHWNYNYWKCVKYNQRNDPNHWLEFGIEEGKFLII